MNEFFLSTYINKIDPKGRVSLPSSFRTILNTNNTDNVIIFKSLTKQCLEGCSVNYLREFDNIINQLDPLSYEKDSFLTTIFGDSVQINFDQDGRIVINKKYLDYANIKDNALFVGKGKTFEIWNSDIFNVYSENCRKFAIENFKLLKNK